MLNQNCLLKSTLQSLLHIYRLHIQTTINRHTHRHRLIHRLITQLHLFTSQTAATARHYTQVIDKKDFYFIIIYSFCWVYYLILFLLLFP